MSVRPETRRIEERVLRFIRRSGALRAGERVLVAVSGGADSSALLCILAAVASRLRLDLRAAHFDHGLRPADARRHEADAVAALTAAVGVRLRSGTGDVRRLARERGWSLEDAGRRARYQFLASAASEEGCSVVATGHTLDDQAETVLLHLVRGSGLAGLAGMAARSPWPFGAGPDLTRPLLELRRADTTTYCRTTGIAPVEDESNMSPSFARNRIRQELLPLLRTLNPSIERALARLAASVRGDLALLESMAAVALPGDEGGNELRIAREDLSRLPPALRLHAARLALARLLPEGAGLRGDHIRAVSEAAHLAPGMVLHLPAGLRLYAGYKDLLLSWGKEPVPTPMPAEPVPLAVPGITEVGGWRLEVEPTGLAAAPPGGALLDADAVGPWLAVRRRRPGDRFQPQGMAEEKKLQDVFVDAKVPRQERDAVPLLVCERGIAWVIGMRVAEWARPSEGSRRRLLIRAERVEKKVAESAAGPLRR